MRILFDNAAKRATITSDNELTNYPASNLVSQFLEERWQENFSDPPVAVITVAFDEPEDIDSLFFSYTNATSITAVTNTGAVAIGSTDTIEATTSGAAIDTDDDAFISVLKAKKITGAIYWDDIQEGVTDVTITLYADANPIYLGGIGLGLSYKMPDPAGAIPESFEDNSPSSGSVYGQSLQTLIDPLRTESYSFSGIKRDVVKEIWSQYLTVGLGGKVWLDVTEKNHDFKSPMYCKIEAVPATTKDGKYYNFSMSFTEAR